MATHQHVGAVAPGPVTPASDEARVQPGFIGAGQEKADDCDCADHGQPLQPSDDAASAKRVATLVALFAMNGWELRASPSGGYTVSRWGHARHCTSPDAVEAFAKQVGVRA
jgi:hypothetical protein